MHDVASLAELDRIVAGHRDRFIADYPTPAQAGSVGHARMDAFCRRHGYSGRTKPQVLIDRLRPHLLSAGRGTVAGKSFSALSCSSTSCGCSTPTCAYDKRISDLLHAHPDSRGGGAEDAARGR